MAENQSQIEQIARITVNLFAVFSIEHKCHCIQICTEARSYSKHDDIYATQTHWIVTFVVVVCTFDGWVQCIYLYSINSSAVLSLVCGMG